MEFATDSRKSETALLRPLVLLEHPVTTGLVDLSVLWSLNITYMLAVLHDLHILLSITRDLCPCDSPVLHILHQKVQWPLRCFSISVTYFLLISLSLPVWTEPIFLYSPWLVTQNLPDLSVFRIIISFFGDLFLETFQAIYFIFREITLLLILGTICISVILEYLSFHTTPDFYLSITVN